MNHTFNPKILCLFLIPFFANPSGIFAQENKHLSKQELIEDARQMLNLLENVHPQPYYNGGGKMAFHQRFQNVLRAIPKDGMTREDFRGLLSPLLASVGDGHTYVYPDSPLDFSGIPLLFYVVEKNLFVSAVTEEKYKYLFGARLISVEGVPFDEIVRRTKLYYGADNLYGTLAQLANFELFLAKKRVLEDLIPEWKNQAYINATFLMPDGKTREVKFQAKPRPNFSLIRPNPGMELPSLNGLEFGWGFLSGDKDIAYLRVQGMTENRETYEKRATFSDVSEEARNFYSRVYGKETKESVDKVIEKLPSLSESYRNLVVQMKKNRTRALVIDLRTNVGGWAIASDMLIYYLYGKEALIELHRKTNIAVRKLSPYYLQNEPDESLSEINAPSAYGERPFKLHENDYDFRDYEKLKNGKLDREYAKQIVENDLALSKTFYQEYTKGAYSNYYCPEKVFVVTDVATFSAGFMFAKYLELMGAITVGSTPSQNTMQMGETVHYELKNSKLYGSISHSFLVHDAKLLNSPNPKNLLTPQYELTYDKLKEFKFARHAVIQYIMELLNMK